MISKLQDKNLKYYLNMLLPEHFLFDGNYYDQTDEVAMDSPLGLALVNFSMDFHEKRWLDQFQFCSTLLYSRHADDVIRFFNAEQDVNEFSKFLSSQHPNIKVTFEKQKDAKLAFLAVLFSKTDQNFCTSVYRKMNFNRLIYINFASFTPYTYKIGLPYFL